MYDIAIIGGGVSGLVTASGAAQFGAKVALVEKGKLGGDCLNFGCVPTKTLVHSAALYHKISKASEHGIDVGDVRLNFEKVMERMRSIQKKIGEHDDPERFRKMGVDIFFGNGSFSDPNTFLVNGNAIVARKFLIATGSRPDGLNIPGSESVDYLNNETVLNLNKLPKSMLVLGAGPIGIEYAQVFARFGCKVTVFQRRGKILPKEDPELTKILWDILEKEGVSIETVKGFEKVESKNGSIELTANYADGKPAKTFKAEKLFVATGRKPNIENLNLSGIGVETDKKGIVVDSSLKTSVPNIWACGDVNGKYQFTHAAEFQAGVVISNALFPLVRRNFSKALIPWCTFTNPELARAGLTEAEAIEKLGAGSVKVYRYDYRSHDRAIMDGETDGMVKLVCNKKGVILGAHIIGAGAADMMHEYALAMTNGLTMAKISQTVHIYPSMGQIVKRGADQYFREKLFSGPFTLFTKFLFGRK